MGLPPGTGGAGVALSRTLLIAWAVFLVGALTLPLFSPGDLALRDMLVLGHPALSPAAFGFGDLPARNAPQDGVLALAGLLIDASWLARLLIVAGAGGAVAGAWWLTRVVNPTASAWSVAAAMTVAVWNPLVVERLLQGQWSLVIAAWLLPLVAAAAMAGRPWAAGAAIFAASLTPTGAVIATAVAVATARTWAARAGLAAAGAALSLPWLVPGLVGQSTSTASSAAAFAPRAEQFAGTPGSLLGLGGIWNSAAVPASREAGFALFGVALAAVLATAWRRCPAALLALAAVGLGGAALAWLAPELVGVVVSEVPGGGLLRDSQKLLLLAVPGYVALAGLLGRWPAIAALVLALLQVPDAPRELQQLRPVEIAVDTGLTERADGRDVYFPGRGTLMELEGRVVLDPYSKAVSKVESGELRVDGRVTDPPTRRYQAVERAWADGDMNALERLGVGLVVTPEGEVRETGAKAAPIGPGVVLTLWWLLLGGALTYVATRSSSSSKRRPV